jgi:hypothetical protein
MVLPVSDPGPFAKTLLNNLKHIEDLTHTLKKEKTTFLLLPPSFVENVGSFYSVARRTGSCRLNPWLPFGESSFLKDTPSFGTHRPTTH